MLLTSASLGWRIPQLLALSTDTLCDAVVVVEGLGSLSLLPDVSGGPVSEVPLRDGAALPVSSMLWVASLSSDQDDDDEVLVPPTPLASTKGDISSLVLDTIDVHHYEKVPTESYDGLFVAAVILGDEEG
jgi:hypothetical protein